MVVLREGRSLRRAKVFILGGALFALGSLGAVRPAHAEGDFPVALRDALNKRFPKSNFCVPLCNACHLTVIGGPGMFNPFGAGLLASGLVKDDPGLVEGALSKELALNLDVDGDTVTDVEELAAGTAPGFKGTRFCPDDNPTYGCGARIASAPPPVDRMGLFTAGIVVLGLCVVRRQRQLRKEPKSLKTPLS